MTISEPKVASSFFLKEVSMSNRIRLLLITLPFSFSFATSAQATEKKFVVCSSVSGKFSGPFEVLVSDSQPEPQNQDPNWRYSPKLSAEWAKHLGTIPGNASCGVLNTKIESEDARKSLMRHGAIFDPWRPVISFAAGKISGSPSGATKAKFGFGYCTMDNERTYMKDMPVFASSVFPRKSNTPLYNNNINSEWLSFIRSQPGFKGGTRGGCGSAPTEAQARAALERDIGVPLRSHSWAYRKDTGWSPD